MKKKIIVTSVTITIIIVVSLLQLVKNNPIKSYDAAIDELTKNQFLDSSASIHALLQNNDEELFVFIGKNDCKGCQEKLPLIAEYLKTNKEHIYYIDANKIDKSDKIILSQNNIDTVPVLIKAKDKNIIKALDQGGIDKNNLNKFFNNL